MRPAIHHSLFLLLSLVPGSLQQQLDQSNNSSPFPAATYPSAESPDPAAAVTADFSPPYYPSPWGNGDGDWADAYVKAKQFVAQLTLLEKVNLTTGTGWQSTRCVGETGSVPRLGFRRLCLQDSPLGIRFADYVSAFPAGVNVAATWDRGLAFARGAAMGSEHREKGVDVQLGPAAGPLGRSPEGGRNWEGFSPDPILTGALFAETIRGIQSEGVIACAKHFIANEQEHFRQAPDAAGYGYNISASLSANIDDATMHELYLWPFAEAVRAGAGSVMCSYNQVNNSYACQNSYIQNYLLKGELDFQGFIVSDWSGSQSGVSDVLAGLDMTMPGDTKFNSGASYFGANLTIAVLNGSVPEWRIDDMATRIVAAWYKVGRDRTSVPVNFDSWSRDTFGNEYFFSKQGYGLINEHVDVRDEHAGLIRQIGASSTVLLKNNHSLPLTGKEKFTAVFGYDAGENPYGPNGCPDHGCDNGTLAQGWGSGTSDFPYLVTPDTALQNEVVRNGGIYQSITNNYAGTQINALASQASVAIVFANSDSGEGYITVDGNVGDRNNLTFWNGMDIVVQNVSASCNNTILVIHSSGPVSIGDYTENPNITAILWAGLPGQETGNSIADVLYGRVNPSAKLPFTLARTRQDYGTDVLYKPNNGANAPQLAFTEGSFIDYRSLDQRDIDPVYEFGFGLSYTNFSYSELQITRTGSNATYNPTRGLTPQAPGSTNATNANSTTSPFVTNSSAPVASGAGSTIYQLPSDFSALPFYIYPYLNSTDLQKASNSSNYGDDSFIPPNSQNGSAQPLLPAGGAPGGNGQLYEVLYRVRATISNVGSRSGEEVAQLYLSLGGPYDPPKVLRGFQKLSIEPGRTSTFVVDLTRKDLSNWDTASQNWVIRDTVKTVYVGASSRNLPLKATLPSSRSSSY